MTATVKLPAQLEQSLRQRCLQEGRSMSEIIRDALTAYLSQAPSVASAWTLGEGVFGRFSGPADLAEQRKSELLSVWTDKQARRL